jgi:hypothetical protein
MGAAKFGARIRELVEDLPDLAELVEPLLIVRGTLREQIARHASEDVGEDPDQNRCNRCNGNSGLRGGPLSRGVREGKSSP